MSALNKMKKGEIYYVVSSWGHNREDSVWQPTRVEKVVALTGGAKAPKVACILEDGRADSEHWQHFLDGRFGPVSVYATREEAENAEAR